MKNADEKVGRRQERLDQKIEKIIDEKYREIEEIDKKHNRETLIGLILIVLLSIFSYLLIAVLLALLFQFVAS